MKTEQDLKIDKVEKGFIITNIMKRHVTEEEAYMELQNLTKEEHELKNKLTQTEAMLKDKTLENNIEQYSKSLETLNTFKMELTNATEDYSKEIETKLRQEVKKIKAEKRYSNPKDPNLKAVQASKIMAEALLKVDLDVSHPIARKVRYDFDKI